jgi:uncharacterized repeat protein (TIGR01451 family)
VSSDQVPPVSGEPVITQVEKLDFLQLNKVASADIVFPGDLVTYTLTVTNDHPQLNTTHVVLSDVLPLGSTFVSATEPYTLAGDSVSWDFASLEPLQSVSVELVVRVGDLPGVLVNAEYVASSDQARSVAGAPVGVPMGRVFFLPLVVRGP